MIDAMGFRIALIAAVAAALPGAASASLGGNESSINTDRVHVQGALVRIARTDAYTLHELQSATGVAIREFVSPTGTVFGVAWQGPWMPDLRQILGTYFDDYQRALAARGDRKRRGPVSIETPGLVVQVSGHQRSFSGRAYDPQLVPQGVDPAIIQ